MQEDMIEDLKLYARDVCGSKLGYSKDQEKEQIIKKTDQEIFADLNQIIFGPSAMFSHTISHALLSIVGLIQQNRKKKQIIKINFTVNNKNNNSFSDFEKFVLELRKII